MGHVQFTLHSALTRWQWSAFPLCMMALLIAIAIWYLRADWALAARGRRWPGSRTAAFMAGLVSIDVALQSPVATFTGTYFQAHVIQHLLLMAVAPPLLALGAPSTLLLQTAGRTTKARWIGLLRSRPFALLSNPITAWFLYFGVMVAFFLTPLVNVAMNHMALMDALNLTFFFGGTLYWWPMIGNDPIMHGRMGHGARMLNILLGSGVEAFLGVAILANVHPVASMYSLSSTHAGGALLWTSTEVVTLAAFVPIFLQWMRSEDRIGARADRESAAAEARRSSLPAGSPVPRELTAWELAWIERTGSVPLQGGPAPHPEQS